MLSTHLPIFSTHLPISRRKLSRPTAVGRCVPNEIFADGRPYSAELMPKQMLNRQSTLVCSHR